MTVLMHADEVFQQQRGQEVIEEVSGTELTVNTSSGDGYSEDYNELVYIQL